MNSGFESSKMLERADIRNADDLSQWLTTASKKEIRELTKLLDSPSAFALISLKELADAFYIYPYQVRPSTGSAEERVY